MGKNAVASSQNSHLHFAGRQTSMIERFSLRFFSSSLSSSSSSLSSSSFVLFVLLFISLIPFLPTPPHPHCLPFLPPVRDDVNGIECKNGQKKCKNRKPKRKLHTKKRESGRRSRFAYRAGFALLFLVTRYFLREKCSKRNKRTTKQQTNKQTKEKRPTKHSLFVDGPCIIDVPGRTFH